MHKRLHVSQALARIPDKKIHLSPSRCRRDNAFGRSAGLSFRASKFQRVFNFCICFPFCILTVFQDFTIITDIEFSHNLIISGHPSLAYVSERNLQLRSLIKIVTMSCLIGNKHC